MSYFLPEVQTYVTYLSHYYRQWIIINFSKIATDIEILYIQSSQIIVCYSAL